MKRRYEGLIVLNTQGKDEGVQDMITRLEKDFKTEGAEVQEVQRFEKRPFAYAPRKVEAGYYVNFIFDADPGAIDRLKTKFKLDPDIYLQHYQLLKQTAQTPSAS